MTLPARFWDKVAPANEDGCMLWTAARSQGYGAYRVEGVTRRAHLTLYRDQVGPVPEGLVLDHLCRNRACVNPEHLEPVTRKENALRGERSSRTHCPQGHEYTEANTYRTITGHRFCRTCNRERARARYVRKG